MAKRTPPPPELVTFALATLQSLTLDRDDQTEILNEFFAEQYALAGGAVLYTVARDAAQDIGESLRPGWNPVDPTVVTWARANAAALVTEIRQGEREAIAQIIAESVWERRGVPGAGRALRPALIRADIKRKAGVYAGLTARRIATVENYRVLLEERGYRPADIERLVERKATQERNDRARVIAQNEMRNAVQKAQLEQARRFGSREKRWSTTNDGKVSAGCLANQAEGWIDIEETHQSGHDAPPRHPRCRCSELYRVSDIQDLRRRMESAGVI